MPEIVPFSFYSTPFLFLFEKLPYLIEWVTHYPAVLEITLQLWQKSMNQSNLGMHDYTANILTVLSTAFGSVTSATVIWLHILQP